MPIELDAHKLVIFQRFVVYLLHLTNKMSVLIVVSSKHYHRTIYWFYVSRTFVFLMFLLFRPESPSALPQIL